MRKIIIFYTVLTLLFYLSAIITAGVYNSINNGSFDSEVVVESIPNENNTINNGTFDTTIYIEFLEWSDWSDWWFITYNSIPSISNPNPSNKSSSQPTSFIWSVVIEDQEGDHFNWTIECSNGQTNSSDNDVNGTKVLELSGLAENESYLVWVNATDYGIESWSRKIYKFNTISSFSYTIKNGYVSYFSWLGKNITASDFRSNLSSFDSSSEYIGIWNRGYWDATYGNWLYYYGDGTGSDFALNTLTVVKIFLEGAGDTEILMAVNGDIDYSRSITYKWNNNSINHGYNFSIYNKNTKTSLSTINSSVTLQPGEAIAVWNSTLADWNWWIPGFLENDYDVNQWDVILSKVEDTEIWTT